MKSILVTGCAGFIGSNFVPYFLEKYPDYRIVNKICEILDKLCLPSTKNSISYKSPITFVKDRAGYDRCDTINVTKVETKYGWKANETFESGIVKTVERYLKKYNMK